MRCIIPYIFGSVQELTHFFCCYCHARALASLERVEFSHIVRKVTFYEAWYLPICASLPLGMTNIYKCSVLYRNNARAETLDRFGYTSFMYLTHSRDSAKNFWVVTEVIGVNFTQRDMMYIYRIVGRAHMCIYFGVVSMAFSLTLAESSFDVGKARFYNTRPHATLKHLDSGSEDPKGLWIMYW